MFKVVESWEGMDEDEFKAVMYVLLHAGYIGSRGTLKRYRLSIGNMARAYHKLARKVRMALPSCVLSLPPCPPARPYEVACCAFIVACRWGMRLAHSRGMTSLWQPYACK